MRLSRALIAALVPLAVSAAPAPTVFKSPGTPPHLIELYTSQGCSSCPPADLWFSALETEPELWTEFVPVAMHVDYWNHLGWRDVFGSKRYSVRQRREAGAGRLYTPGFFLNGREWKGFFDGASVPPPNLADAGSFSVTRVSDNEFLAEFKPRGFEKGPLTLTGTLLAMDLEVDVTAGENRGKRLGHDFVALGVRSVPMKRFGGRYGGTLKLRNDTPASPRRMAAAFWITRKDSFEPVQVAGGYLDME